MCHGAHRGALSLAMLDIPADSKQPCQQATVSWNLAVTHVLPGLGQLARLGARLYLAPSVGCCWYAKSLADCGGSAHSSSAAWPANAAEGTSCRLQRLLVLLGGRAGGWACSWMAIRARPSWYPSGALYGCLQGSACLPDACFPVCLECCQVRKLLCPVCATPGLFVTMQASMQRVAHAGNMRSARSTPSRAAFEMHACVSLSHVSLCAQ